MGGRAASIWRAVTRSGSIAFSPYSPKFRIVPPFAIPWMRPLWALRNFVRFGCSIVLLFQILLASGRVAAPRRFSALECALLRAERIVLENLALEDPDLDPARAIGRVSGGVAVVDVSAERVERHAALAV